MCPNDYLLAGFVDGSLSKNDLLQIENHLKECITCFEKIFFLKKSLFRESLFIKEEKLNKLILAVNNMNVWIKEKIGSLTVNPLKLAYRNNIEEKNAVHLEINKIHINVEKIENEIKLIFLSEGDISILNNKTKRIVFTGMCRKDQSILLKSDIIYEFVSNNEKLILEFKNV